jgi:hypothetical protein
MHDTPAPHSQTLPIARSKQQTANARSAAALGRFFIPPFVTGLVPHQSGSGCGEEGQFGGKAGLEMHRGNARGGGGGVKSGS